MDFTNDGLFSRPSTLFKTLRRLHGQNLENQGLNNLTDAFQNFMTRAKYFSIGRMRRTWSHSAVEFLKYRRLLPMLTSDNEKGDQFADDCAIPTTSWYDGNNDIFGCDPALSKVEVSATAQQKGEKRIVVSNISPRVTSNQLISFFSKFGKVAICHIPSEERRQSMYATIPKSSRSSVTAQVKFRKFEDAQRALKASDDELKFYDRIMVVSEYRSTKKRSSASISSRENFASNMNFSDYGDTGRLSQATSDLSLCSDVLSISEVRSTVLLSSQLLIDNLPVKVIAHILSFLSPLDRIKVEGVNKNFLEAAAKAWAMNDSLSFGKDATISRFFTSQNPMRNHHLQAFLTKAGLHLKSLDLSGVTHLLDEKAFEIISSLCPKLREINISGLTADCATLRAFSDALPRILCVTYKDMVNVSDRSMWSLFRGNGVNIQKIDLRGCKRIKGRCLKNFSLKLERAFLDGCSRLDNVAIEDLCLQSPNLKELRLSGCFYISDESISLISRCMTDLECFSLCGDGFDFVTPSGLMALSRLQALTELTLDYNSSVSNELLEALFVSVPYLQTLSIAYAGCDTTITEDALKGLATLIHLETLDLSSLAAVTNSVLVEVASKCLELRNLRLRSCTYLGDEGVIAAANLLKLELLDLSGCLLVTNSAVQTLLDAFRINPSVYAVVSFLNNVLSQPIENGNIFLKKGVVHTVSVVIGGTISQIGGLRTVGSRVVLDLSDYSALISNTARRHLYNCSDESNKVVDSDEELSGDEFEALNAHRAFVIEVEQGEEEISSPENDRSIMEWAEREALHLGLIK